MENRKLILYISMSLDGFIAAEDDDISWLDVVDKEGEDYGYHAFIKSVDTYIIGRRTYEKVLELTGGKFPQGEQFDCYVITRSEKKSENGVTFFNGNIEQLINDIRTQAGKNIYCDGGGQIVSLLASKNLIDEYIISIIPVILGKGKRLFPGETESIKLKAESAKRYETGLVQLHYIRE